MPVTPFHFGPAALAKAITPRCFSFIVFGLTQVVIDTEPLYYMARGAWPIHRFFHTYLGATVVAVLAAFAGRPLCEGVLRLWNRRLSPTQRDWLGVASTISFAAAATGAFFGAYSHVLLDSIMHSDMRPLAPLSNGNSLLHVASIEHLYISCAGLGAAGGVMLLRLLARRRMVG